MDYGKTSSPNPPWPVVMIASYAFPGLGHFVRGERRRAAIIGIGVLTVFFAGLLIGGVRVVEFPTFPPAVPGTNPTGRIVAGLLSQIPFLAQFFAGPLTFGAGVLSHNAASNAATAGIMAHGRVADIAILYTGVAGALNLLAIIDATARSAAGQPPRDQIETVPEGAK